MEILNLGGAQESTPSSPKSRKPLRVLLGIGALAAVTGIGSTLAATITLSGDNSVEFGQGVVTTAACDGTITVTPVSSYDNASGTFELASISLADINNTACSAMTLTVKGWEETDPTALFSTTFAGSNASGSIDMTSYNILASDLYKITIESADGV